MPDARNIPPDAHIRGFRIEVISSSTRHPVSNTEGNLALCCYWCNNAKTDEFTAAEFPPVADALALVWRRRLALLEEQSLMSIT